MPLRWIRPPGCASTSILRPLNNLAAIGYDRLGSAAIFARNVTDRRFRANDVQKNRSAALRFITVFDETVVDACEALNLSISSPKVTDGALLARDLVPMSAKVGFGVIALAVGIEPTLATKLHPLESCVRKIACGESSSSQSASKSKYVVISQRGIR
jgi:hypothetical protein